MRLNHFIAAALLCIPPIAHADHDDQAQYLVRALAQVGAFADTVRDALSDTGLAESHLSHIEDIAKRASCADELRQRSADFTVAATSLRGLITPEELDAVYRKVVTSAWEAAKPSPKSKREVSFAVRPEGFKAVVLAPLLSPFFAPFGGVDPEQVESKLRLALDADAGLIAPAIADRTALVLQEAKVRGFGTRLDLRVSLIYPVSNSPVAVSLKGISLTPGVDDRAEVVAFALMALASSPGLVLSDEERQFEVNGILTQINKIIQSRAADVRFQNEDQSDIKRVYAQLSSADPGRETQLAALITAKRWLLPYLDEHLQSAMNSGAGMFDRRTRRTQLFGATIGTERLPVPAARPPGVGVSAFNPAFGYQPWIGSPTYTAAPYFYLPWASDIAAGRYGSGQHHADDYAQAVQQDHYHSVQPPRLFQDDLGHVTAVGPGSTWQATDDMTYHAIELSHHVGHDSAPTPPDQTSGDGPTAHDLALGPSDGIAAPGGGDLGGVAQGGGDLGGAAPGGGAVQGGDGGGGGMDFGGGDSGGGGGFSPGVDLGGSTL